MPDESHLQDAAGNLEAGSAERQLKAKFEARFLVSSENIWQFGLPTQQAIWKLAAQNGR